MKHKVMIYLDADSLNYIDQRVLQLKQSRVSISRSRFIQNLIENDMRAIMQ